MLHLPQCNGVKGNFTEILQKAVPVQFLFCPHEQVVWSEFLLLNSFCLSVQEGGCRHKIENMLTQK